MKYNDPAFPTQNGCRNDPGLTKREHIATLIMAGFISSQTQGYEFRNASDCAEQSVQWTDALISELSKAEKP